MRVVSTDVKGGGDLEKIFTYGTFFLIIALASLWGYQHQDMPREMVRTYVKFVPILVPAAYLAANLLGYTLDRRFRISRH